MRKLRNILLEVEFIIKPYSRIINTSYILRNGLHRAINLPFDEISRGVLDFGSGSKPYEKVF